MAELRVTLVSSEWSPHIQGGLGVHVDQLTAALVGRVEFEVFVPQAEGYLRGDPSVRLHEVAAPEAPSHVGSWESFSLAAAELAARLAPTADLVHCHDWSTALAGAELRRRLGLPLVFTDHLPQLVEPRRRLEEGGLAAADLVIVPSAATGAEVSARGLPIRRLEVVPNGVDPDVFCPAPDWPRDGGYALFVGRLVAQKGVDCLLQAFGVVLRRLPDCRLIVAGDGDLELYLKRVARHLGFPHRVEFRGWTTGSALVELYRRARVVVVPSYYEPFGIVALEAMACARPVVASRVGGLAEVIEDGVQGHLVPPGDHLLLARRLGELLADDERSRRMGAAARRRAALFTWRAAGDKTLSLYRDLVERRAGAAAGADRR